MWKNGAKKFHGVEKWTAWKPSLQKAETADDAKVQTVAGGGDPGVLWFSVAGGGDPGVLWFSVAGGGDPGTGLNEPGYRTANSPNSRQPGLPRHRAMRGKPRGGAASRTDGVEAVPPEDRNSRKAAGPRFSVPVFWRDGLHPVHAVGCWLLAVGC